MIFSDFCLNPLLISIFSEFWHVSCYICQYKRGKESAAINMADKYIRCIIIKQEVTK